MASYICVIRFFERFSDGSFLSFAKTSDYRFFLALFKFEWKLHVLKKKTVGTKTLLYENTT